MKTSVTATAAATAAMAALAVSACGQNVPFRRVRLSLPGQT